MSRRSASTSRLARASSRRLVAEEGRGILWATHLLDEIEMSDRLVVLHKGRVLAQGSVQDVLAEAGDTDLQTAFLKLVNAPGTTSAGREAAE
jgi:ABC-2 type transport system ATP-binding protein